MIEWLLYEKDCKNIGYVTVADNRLCFSVWCICFYGTGRWNTELFCIGNDGMYPDDVWGNLLPDFLSLPEKKKNRCLYSCIALLGFSERYGMVPVWPDFSERALWTVSIFTSGRGESVSDRHALSAGGVAAQ